MTDFEMSPADQELPGAPLELRSSSVAEVNSSQRVIEVIAAPYEEVAAVPWRGEVWQEMFMRGAWDGVEAQPTRVRANREHDTSRTVGKVINFYPSRQEGLVAEVKIAKTLLGDETLALAEEGCLGASVGYKARPRDVVLDKVNRLRSVHHAFIDHLAFAADELYAGAQVLAVRSATAASAADPVLLETPALDELNAWLQARQR